MPYYDEEMTDRAVEAYFARAKKRGYEPQQPNRSLTERSGERIYIRNGADKEGLLATYRVHGDSVQFAA
jgi:hypothetical protein